MTIVDRRRPDEPRDPPWIRLVVHLASSDAVAARVAMIAGVVMTALLAGAAVFARAIELAIAAGVMTVVATALLVWRRRSSSSGTEVDHDPPTSALSDQG